MRMHNNAKWRCCLFASVDITGSTAFKAQHQPPYFKVQQQSSLQWTQIFRNFFRHFPGEVNRAERELRRNSDLAFRDATDASWQIWKFLGDEILLWAEIHKRDDVFLHIQSILGALSIYEQELRQVAPSLGLKSTIWVSNLPLPNAEVHVQQRDSSGNPVVIRDFLGPGIDLGFRLGKFAGSRKIPISAGLAYLLFSPPNNEIRNGIHINYDGKYSLKGIMGDRPYPIFWIDRRRGEPTFEDMLRKIDHKADHNHACKFLEEFFDTEPCRIRPFCPGDPASFWHDTPSTLLEQWRLIEADNIENKYHESIENSSNDTQPSSAPQDDLEKLIPKSESLVKKIAPDK